MKSVNELINKHIDPYSPDVSEGDHLYNQGKAEGIEIGFNAAIEQLSQGSGEFETHWVYRDGNLMLGDDALWFFKNRKNEEGRKFLRDEKQLIDIAALASLQAKLLKAEQENERLRALVKTGSQLLTESLTGGASLLKTNNYLKSVCEMQALKGESK